MSRIRMIYSDLPAPPGETRARLRAAHHADESQVLRTLIATARFDSDAAARVVETARGLVKEVRRERLRGLDAFLNEYRLSSQEGVVLMCLAEALLRVPDPETRSLLIRDKIGEGHWDEHLGRSESLFVNASTWALALTGRMVRLDEDSAGSVLRRLVQRSGEPFVRQAVEQAMRVLARNFVMATTVETALDRARDAEKRGYRHSFDMLGEAARTAADARRYFDSYAAAIRAVGHAAKGRGPLASPGVSVKLSALHARYEHAQRHRVMTELVPSLRELAVMARDAGIGLTIDAEEADRLDLSLDVIQAMMEDAALIGWDGFGVAVQAYQKRALPLLDCLSEIARQTRHCMPVRLVKGAYWDTEIKRAQEQGLQDYPVFTRKANTDVSFLACVRRVFAEADVFYPQIATHNAHSVAAVLEIAAGRRDFEFQRLHGMGEALYDRVIERWGVPCRVYAPVGSHEELLPYLVRRLLENGANTSFVNRLGDPDVPVDEIVADPVARAEHLGLTPHPRIPRPADIYAPERRNSEGIDLSDPEALRPLAQAMSEAAARPWRAAPMVSGRQTAGGGRREALSPADRRQVVGVVREAGEADVEAALAAAAAAAPSWDATPAARRAAALERAAELYEAHRAELMALCVREAGKTIPDAVGEVREAVDFLRYYASRARRDFGAPWQLPGPTGESDHLSLHGRGVFACISPWNFPLAIFTGQTAAALAAGNAVVAKPAEQTPLIAAFAVGLLHEAGVPPEVLHLLPGDGARIGGALVADARVAGVAFTGSTETARLIHRSLAGRPGPIARLIAETGGQNAMIVDSSALPEQVVADVLTSSFRSTGQRCSALRVLFVQEDGAKRLLDMLAGALDELAIGDPALLSTDVGPVIDEEALAGLVRHVERMEREARLVHRPRLPAATEHGVFLAPQIFEVESMKQVEHEVFGPILHVIRYPADGLEAVLEAIQGTGYGLTMGIHSRIDTTIRRVAARARVGNLYVNRSMIGAVVGTQPFGGEGLSGTGPKAGGPHYLTAFATERCLSVNTTAAGGNAALLTLKDDEM